MTPKSRLSVRVEGVVQGVGFRPFVRNLAARLGLAGFVGNDASGVFIEVEGDSEQLSAFLADLEDEAPPLSVIDRVTEPTVEGDRDGRVRDSGQRRDRRAAGAGLSGHGHLRGMFEGTVRPRQPPL